MVDPFPGVPYSFGALRKTFGPLWVRCDSCRRYARLHLRELRDVDYRTKTFSCSICGSDGAMALDEPCKDTGMEDYRLDQRVDPAAGRGEAPDGSAAASALGPALTFLHSRTASRLKLCFPAAHQPVPGRSPPKRPVRPLE